MTRLDPQLARHMARLALGHVTREYPHKLDHVLTGDGDALPPEKLHPIFFGSFDWHSCVHSWWTLLTLARQFPAMAETRDIIELADASFTSDKVAAELSYLDRPFSRGFERPYGWAWLLQLHLEASRHDRCWSQKLEPLATAFAGRLGEYLRVLTYPIRVGTHFNSAFALILSLEWARMFDPQLGTRICEISYRWFGNDRDCQAWEPGGDDFLSSALTEALCMARSNPDRFGAWFQSFLPRISNKEPASLFAPAIVSDRSDGKIAHLDGLNLSRSWCWSSLAPWLEPDQRLVALGAAKTHLDAAIGEIAGDYMGEHWLASFALLALLAPDHEAEQRGLEPRSR